MATRRYLLSRILRGRNVRRFSAVPEGISASSSSHQLINLEFQCSVHKDVSYNNFTGSQGPGCQFSSVNLVASHSPSTSNTTPWCLKRDLPCSSKPEYYSLFINCGGRKISFEGNEYEENLSGDGPSHFESHDRWAYSSTGKFMGNANAKFVATNNSSLTITGAEFYQTACLAPSSLKYFGLCLFRGSYRVRLHFAEIMYTNDTNFS